MTHGGTPGRPGRNSDGLIRERATVAVLIRMYCQGVHGSGKQLCAECDDLLAYAMRRLDHCPFGGKKPKCADCSIHCYQAAMQIRICRVMRYAGPLLAKASRTSRAT